MTQLPILRKAQVTVRRTEVAGMDQFVRSIDVAHILLRGVEDPLDMMISMIADGVPPALYLLKELGIAAHIVRHAEESSLDTQLIELIQYPRRDLGYRTIIEGKVDTLARERGDTPARPRDKHAVPHRYPTEKTLNHRVEDQDKLSTATQAAQ